MSLPSGYTQLEYIQSSGTQYINTGFKPNQDTRVTCDFEYISSVEEQTIFMARRTSAQDQFGLFHNTSGWTFRYGANSAANNTIGIMDRILLDINKNVATLNGVKLTNSAATFNTGTNLMLFVRNTNGTLNNYAIAKLYACSIYSDETTMIRNFIPCKNPSGVIGLYDLVNNQFYQNAGTGSFVAGAEVKGSHKTLIDGTWYDLKAGKCLVGGTAYSVKKGRVLVNSTGYNIPFSSGIPLSTITPGAILYLNESGSPVPFYIAKHDYESGLNGGGRTLVVRRDCYDKRGFNKSNNTYSGSQMDTWLTGTYLNLLSSDVKKAVSTTKFKIANGTNASISTLERSVFILSCVELGRRSGFGDGEALPIAEKMQIAKINGTAVGQWTRTPGNNSTVFEVYLSEAGFSGSARPSVVDYGSRPAFPLPATTAVTANPDGTYTLAA